MILGEPQGKARLQRWQKTWMGLQEEFAEDAVKAAEWEPFPAEWTQVERVCGKRFVDDDGYEGVCAEGARGACGMLENAYARERAWRGGRACGAVLACGVLGRRLQLCAHVWWLCLWWLCPQWTRVRLARTWST